MLQINWQGGSILVSYYLVIDLWWFAWYSKQQNTVESSTFASEFIATKCCIEHITALQFKLRMFGVLMDVPAKIFCNNKSVVRKSSFLASSTLNKKHSSVACHHMVRWAVAAKWNLANAFTKRLMVDARNQLFGEWTFWYISYKLFLFGSQFVGHKQKYHYKNDNCVKFSTVSIHKIDTGTAGTQVEWPHWPHLTLSLV